MDLDRFCRSIGAEKSIIKTSFAGLIGHLNVKEKIRKVGGLWVRSTQRPYDNIPDLPEIGVETARMIANKGVK
ncbi:MAG TPA: hypothetical protein PK883_09440 [Anaerolineaceae bacterium]|nr:hypothetical protein [Anaerolineaceae bacterium]